MADPVVVEAAWEGLASPLPTVRNSGALAFYGLARNFDLSVGERLIRRAPELNDPDSVSCVILAVVASNPAEGFVAALSDIVGLIPPPSRLTVVHMLGRIGSTDALAAIIRVLDEYFPDGLEYPGWGNPLWDLEVRPAHGEVLFPRLFDFRRGWLAPLIDWVIVAYLAAGELDAQMLAGQPAVVKALRQLLRKYGADADKKDRRTLSRPPSTPSAAWWRHPDHQAKRTATVAIIRALGGIADMEVLDEVLSLLRVGDPWIRAEVIGIALRAGREVDQRSIGSVWDDEETRPRLGEILRELDATDLSPEADRARIACEEPSTSVRRRRRPRTPGPGT